MPHIVAIEGIARDISERKDLEARLDRAQQMEVFGLLAAGTAHDINNMLTLIRGHCQILLDEVHPNDPIKHRFEGIMEASEKAALFARQMLAFGRRRLEGRAIVDVSAVVASMKGLLSRLVGHQIQLIIELDSEAGSAKAHPGQIEQIVLNLVVNARDAMIDGGTLTVTTFPARPFTGLLVSDTGRRMARESAWQLSAILSNGAPHSGSCFLGRTSKVEYTLLILQSPTFR